jgi:hypothetical protein
MVDSFYVGRYGDGAHPFKAPSVIDRPGFNITAKDKEILRELGKIYLELASQNVNKGRIKRIKDNNDLKPGRPPVWIDELPWHELDIDGQLSSRCESNEAQILERFLRRILFRWKYFQADMVVDEAIYLMKSFTSSGIGISVKEKTISTDSENAVVSHHYEDQLDTDAKVEALKVPVVQVYPEIDKRNLEIVSDIFAGILPVKLRGYSLYYTPWDSLSEFRSVENCLSDLMDRPEFIHKTMKKMTEIGLSFYLQMEALGLLDYNIEAIHCTPPYSNEIPAKDYDGGNVRQKDVWFRGHAQMFVMVSPEMREEFDIQYMRTLMDKFALCYYGCCEPLDKFIPYLKKIPNMRKIGASPWTDIRSTAEQVGESYVVARKPNPANLAMEFNPDVIRKEISETIEVCMANKCPYEFVLKDVSTVAHKPSNLIDWTKTVTEVIDSYYK